LAIIEIKDLAFIYRGSKKPSIKNIALKINRGDFVILTGPSGCGKTTLCRCLDGLIPHSYPGELEGEVKVADLVVKDHSISDVAQHVGFVLQNPENQLFSLSIERDIAFGLENLALPREEIRERVDWALDIIGLADLRDKAPYELSGGQQQRVAIASVLAMKPEVMILDEPTSFLDPLAAKRLLEIVHKLNKDMNLAIILVEHRLDLVSAYSNRIIIMDEGEIKIDGPPRKVFSDESIDQMDIGLPKVTRLYKELKKERYLLAGLIPLSAIEMVQIIKEAASID
jgi:energy-coupling factor transporter ATP-binding protein EcfA2